MSSSFKGPNVGRPYAWARSMRPKPTVVRAIKAMMREARGAPQVGARNFGTGDSVDEWERQYSTEGWRLLVMLSGEISLRAA